MWIIFLIAAGICLLDQLTKIIVEYTISGHTHAKLINDFLYITKTYNTGAGWSIMDDNTLVLALISLLATIALCYITYIMLKEFKKNVLPGVAMSLVLGGCVGNMIDRFLTVFNARDGVIDFVEMYIFDYSWPVYNVADIALVAGIIVFAIWAIFFEGKGKKKDTIIKEENSDNASEGGEDNA